MSSSPTEERRNLGWQGDNETRWPDALFYIQSKIDRSNWALTVEGNRVKLSRLQPGVEFLWAARKDYRGGAVLTHLSSGSVLTSPELPLVGLPDSLVVAHFDSSNPLQLWRVEDLGSGWVGINSIKNWEEKVNVYNFDVHGKVALYKWCRGQDNEEWVLVHENGRVTVESIDYDLGRATSDLSLPAALGAMELGDNRQGETSITFHNTLSATSTRTSSFTFSKSDTRASKFTQTFGANCTIEKVVGVTASGSFEESQSKSITYSDQETKSESETVTHTVDTQVPPKRKYGFQIVIHRGKCSVPYTAHLKFQSSVPGAQPVRFTSEGDFTGVNLTKCEVVVSDLTQEGASPALVSSHEVPKSELSRTAK